MQDLKTMTIKELRQLAINIKSELDNRIKEIEEVKKEIEELNLDELCSNEYEFYFKTECYYRERGYVAKCYYNKGIQREFHKFDEIKGKNSILIEGPFKAKNYEILDIRYKKTKYGVDGYYIVLNKRLEFICDINDIHKISAINQFLKKNLILENFLELVGLKEIEVKVIDELLED